MSDLYKVLEAINPDLSPGTIAAYVPSLHKAMAKHKINTKSRMAMFLANIAHETDGLRTLEEYGDESYWRSFLGGDWYYHGRGAIMLTWRSNYQAFGQYVGEDLVSNPARVKDLDLAFEVAGWFWTTHNLNGLADAGDFDSVVLRINGGYNGWNDRVKYYKRALNVVPTTLGDFSMASVKAADIVEAARLLRGAPYRWWDGAYPFTPGPAMFHDAKKGKYSPGFVKREGINCTGLINWARAECGLKPIGGTGHYQDWLEAAGGLEFNPNNPGQAGALCVHRYEGGQGLGAEGHIAMYVDEHTLLQAEATNGVWEGEKDYNSHTWANYLVYGLMPDVDYSGKVTPPAPAKGWKWIAVDKNGWLRADGPDWSRGWFDKSWNFRQ